MGWWEAARATARDLLSVPRPLVLDAVPVARFDATVRPIDALIGEMLNAAGYQGHVGRDEALSVAAVMKGRNELCSIATLPLQLYKGLDVLPSPLLRQFDPDVPNVVHLAMTIEDLIFEGIAWWLITATDFERFPSSVRHLDVSSVSLNPPAGSAPSQLPSGESPRGATVWVDGVETSAARLIRFDSPNPGLLKAGARVIRRSLLLDRLAALYAENPRPLDYFTDNDDPTMEQYDDDQVDAFLAQWQAMRRRRATGWIPGEVKRVDVATPSPAEIQLVQLQQQATLELANSLGVDPEDLGISTTSRTYFNAVDKRQTKINNTYAPYMRALTDRLTMGDVTRRGHEVRFDLTDYLKADPTTQAAYWRALFDMKAIDAKEVRAMAGITGRPPKPAPAPLPPPEAPASEPPPADEPPADEPAGGQENRVVPAFTFDTEAEAAFTFDVRATFAADPESRVIRGSALPYGVKASKGGQVFEFAPDSLQWSDLSHVKHLMDHTTPVGNALELTHTPTGFDVALSVLSGVEGSAQKLERDQLLYDAQHGLYNGLSVGVNFNTDPDAGDIELRDDGSVLVLRADLIEVSTTPIPAFSGARVTTVAASRTGGTMPEPLTGTVVAAVPPPAAPVTAPVFAQLPAGTSEAELNAALATLTAARTPVETPALVDPTRRFAATVDEPDPYVLSFDRKGGMQLRPGTHEFSTDLHAYFTDRDTAAGKRALAFVQQQFDVVTSNVTALNPNRQRPDLYVDQRTYRYPVWEAINKGTLSDVTPFVFPLFNSASGLVANHTQGTEPTSGTFTVTSQTVTPSAISGKAKITREVWDQGGNPQVSSLIWNQMLKGWYEALEAYAVATLDAATPTGITLTTGGGTTGQTLVAELIQAFASLQFIRGGFSMTEFPTQIDLYKALVGARDADGRPLFPAIGPMNTNGTAGSRWAQVSINGVESTPAWALAASGTVAASSYLFDRDSVHGWASAPQRLTMDMTEVANVYLGIWGYKAATISDINGVREVIYDPV